MALEAPVQFPVDFIVTCLLNLNVNMVIRGPMGLMGPMGPHGGPGRAPSGFPLGSLWVPWQGSIFLDPLALAVLETPHFFVFVNCKLRAVRYQ